MVRVKRGTTARQKRSKELKRAKGFRLGLRTQMRRRKTALLHALKHATMDRKLRKRDFRSLWIVRINAALKSMGYQYSKFINGLHKLNIKIDRKMLALLAENDLNVFKKLVDLAKSAK
jgi:large subunit ribosomal protein L20